MTPPTAAELERRIAAAAHPEAQSFGARFTSSPTYRALRDGRFPGTGDERATTSVANTSEIIGALRLRTFSDLSAFSVEGVPHVGFMAAPARVPDLVRTVPTQKTQVLTSRETAETIGSVAAGVAESVALPEPAMTAAGPPATTLVPRFGLSWPVTREVLDDPGVVESIINQRMSLGLRQGLERQIIAGAAGDVAGTGILNTTGIGTVAKGTDLRIVAISKGVANVQGNGWYVNPLCAIVHPTTLQAARTEAVATGGVIAWQGVRDVLPEIEAWVPSRLVPAGTAVVGDLSQVMLFVKGPLSIEMSREHQSYLTQDWVSFIAWFRALVWVARADAFCSVTGL